MEAAAAAVAAAAAAAEAAAESQAEAAAAASGCWHLLVVSAEAETSAAELAALAQNRLPSWLGLSSCIPLWCDEMGVLPAECGVHMAGLTSLYSSKPSHPMCP